MYICMCIYAAYTHIYTHIHIYIYHLNICHLNHFCGVGDQKQAYVLGKWLTSELHTPGSQVVLPSLSCQCFLYILDMTLPSIMWFSNMLSYSVGLDFTLDGALSVLFGWVRFYVFSLCCASTFVSSHAHCQGHTQVTQNVFQQFDRFKSFVT